MGGAGTPDFFYREAQRLGYVARSAFKVIFCLHLPPFMLFSFLLLPTAHLPNVCFPLTTKVASNSEAV